MKKIITLSLITTMAFSSVVFAETVVPISTVENTNEQGALVPIREYAENIGYTVTWNNTDKSITFNKGENTFKTTIGSSLYYCDLYNHEPQTIDFLQPSIIVNGTTYVPKEFAEMMIVDPTTITPELPVIDNNGSIDKTVIPKLDTTVAKTIGTVIDDEMATLEQEQLKANEEYKDAYLSTGGSLDDYIEPTYEIGYEILSCDEDYSSLKLYLFQALASSFTEEIYYTFDSKTGEQLSLEYFLGDGYEQKVKDTVVKTATDRMSNDPDNYSYDQESLDNLVIDENTSFYIDENDNIVVAFEKYELAAGVYGSQEFIVGTVN